MTQTQAVAMPQHSLIITMANRYGLERGKFLSTLQGTIFPGNTTPTNEQIAAFLVVANNYSLNPFIKEIYAFPGRSGGIIPIVSIDGWLTIINRQPQLDGIEFHDTIGEAGELVAVAARVYRKDRAHPTEVTEYMAECRRNTDTWRQWPSRMLRHKAMIQAARYAFGLSGIYDPDEAERIVEAGGTVETVVAEKTRENAANLRERLTVVKREVVADDALAIDVGIIESEIGDAIEAASAEPTAEEIDGVDPDESSLEDLRTAVKELLLEKVGGMPGDQKRFLNGKVIANETAETLGELYKDLSAM